MRKHQSAEVRKPEILEHYYQTVIEEGLEGASIGKIAKRMNIHPSLIIHYFKTKHKMTIDLVDLIIDKFEAPTFLDFSGINNPEKRFHRLMDVIFSKEWSKTVDSSVFYGFYYLSFRVPEIRERFKAMFQRFRDYLVREFTIARKQGVVKVDEVHKAADMVVTLMEGMEYHAAFLANGQPFEEFAQYSKRVAMALLTGDPESSTE